MNGARGAKVRDRKKIRSEEKEGGRRMAKQQTAFLIITPT